MTGHGPVLGSMSRPEFTGAGAVYAPLRYLPPAARLMAVLVLVLVSMAACATLTFTRPGPPPGEDVCRAHSFTPERENCLAPEVAR